MKSENPNLVYAQKILQFVQEKQYGRTPEGTDFTDLVGDCGLLCAEFHAILAIV